MNNFNLNLFLKTLRKHKIYHSPKSLIWYFDNYLFKNIDFNKKVFLDIGGGLGLASFYAAAKGAKKVILLEPVEAGFGAFKMEKYYLLKERLLPFSKTVQLIEDKFQNFTSNEKFDIIFSHDSINHLDEAACSTILQNEEAYKTYSLIFNKLYHLCAEYSKLIIADCSNRNFFNDLGIRNPISPQIEWQKHQSPETWRLLAIEGGFSSPVIKYSTFKQLRSIGRVLFGNKLIAYLTYSHFVLNVKKSISK